MTAERLDGRRAEVELVDVAKVGEGVRPDVAGRPIAKADRRHVMKVGERVRRHMRNPQGCNLEHVDVAERSERSRSDVTHRAVMDKYAQEVAHAAEGATVDAIELAIDDREGCFVASARQVVEGVLPNGADLHRVECDACDVGQGSEGVHGDLTQGTVGDLETGDNGDDIGTGIMHVCC